MIMFGLFYLLQLSTEWTQLEVIDLINDGSGLGFGIIGGKSTGVVVKTILPGGVADRVRSRQNNNHILQSAMSLSKIVSQKFNLNQADHTTSSSKRV